MTETLSDAPPAPAAERGPTSPAPAVELDHAGAVTGVSLVSKAAIEDATLDVLLSKPRRVTSFTVTVPNEDGTSRVVRLKYQALDPKEYDRLLEAHPPTIKQQAQGASYNSDTFPPALIAAVSLVPKLTPEQAAELYHAPNWAPGETNELFQRAGWVCNNGLNVPFNDGD